MKKANFMEGAFIATVAIFLVKILGVLYIIPFYSMVGVQGSVLYGYAYSIYVIFLSLSTRGITLAISRIVSEYNALEQYYLKERVYQLAAGLIIALGFLFFIILMIFAPQIAYLILGDLQKGNTIEDVTLVVRLIATALLIVPLLAVTKGYLQGHQFIYPTSISHVLEQFFRVLVIVVGGFIVVNMLGFDIEIGVGVAVLGATVGALIAYGYLYRKMVTNRAALKRDQAITRQEANVSSRELLKKVLLYAMPFILIDILKSGFNLVDTFTVVRTMVDLGSEEIAELTIGIITNLGNKLNMIIISIAIGITISLVPNLAASYAKQDFQAINHRINQTLQVILFVGLPMTVGLYFLIQPTWVLFYSYDEMSISIYQIYLFQALIFAIFSVLVKTLQVMDNIKFALGTLVTLFVLKILFNVPLMHLFAALHWPLYYAPILLTLVIHVLAIILMLFFLHRKYQFSFWNHWSRYVKIVIVTIMMLIILRITNLFIPIEAVTRGRALLEITVYTLIGGLSYLLIAYRDGLLQEIFGADLIAKVQQKMRLGFLFNRK